VKTLSHTENIYMETSLEKSLTVLQFLYSMTRGMTLKLSDSTAQLFARKQSTLSFSKGWYLFVLYFFVIYKAWIHRLCSANLSQMASWKHDVCKLRLYYSFSTLFQWAVAVWVYDEFINSNWQFAVQLTIVWHLSHFILFSCHFAGAGKT
jgi:hypothetical protein